MNKPRFASFFHLFVIFSVFLSMLGSGLGVTPAYAASLTVNKTADTDDGVCDADCSLREAIAVASSGSTIDFDASLSGTAIYLSSTLIVSQSLTIDGSSLANHIILSGDSDNNTIGDVQIFGINGGGTVTLNSLRIVRGKSGGGGGGIVHSGGGTLTVTNSTLAYNEANGGGAISNHFGTLIVTNSTFLSNTVASTGGAIYSSGTTTIANSTFSGNSANIGGGIHIDGTAVTLKNTTLSANSATSNGAGVYSSVGQFNYANTIIANSLSGGDCIITGTATIGTNTNNIVEDNSCSPAIDDDPGLATLANNGGPTLTFALLLASPALDAGDDTVCATSPVSGLDQRGVTRPAGACDIGAFEYVDTVDPSVTSFTATSPSNSLTIPITAFTATDNAFVTGYQITQSATPPGDAGWSGSVPTSYTVSGDGTYTLYPWARDASLNVSAVYGSPVTVIVDTTGPTVVSSVRANSNPTNASSISFTVTFSESVTGVDLTDFSLTTTGVSGAAISGVSGSGATRTVTVSTGSGNGTIRLNVLNNGSILDDLGNSLNGAFTNGQTYNINKTITLTVISAAATDGWLLESSETSNVGGTLNSSATTFNLGDNATKKQYRGVLSFKTSSIPDSAIITGVTLKVKKSAVVGGGNPVTLFQGFFADVKTGFFGTGSALQTADFQATASKTVGPTSPTPAANWYTMNLVNAKTFINKLSSNGGVTQIRLRFKLDDNGNAIANYLSLFSGNATNAVDRPQLVITYYVP